MNKPPPYIDLSEKLGAAWLRPLLPLVGKLSGVSAANRLRVDLGPHHESADAFAEAALRALRVSWRLDGLDPAAGRETGRGTLVLANHPTGIIEALIVMRVLDLISPGNWKILANSWVAAKPEFSAHVIPLDPFAWETKAKLNLRGMRGAVGILKHGGVVGAFPSGRVAARTDAAGRAIDEPWSGHLVRIARASGARILLVHIPLSPGLLLRATPLRFPMLRSLLLPREAMRRRRHGTLRVTLAPAPDRLPENPARAADLLHQSCHESPGTTPD